jgi:hypothetical protein
MSITYKWLNSIDNIEKSDWIRLYENKSILKSFEFTNAVEKSKLEGTEFHYLVVFKDNIIDSILPFYSYKVKLEILAGDSIKKITNLIRVIYPKFLQTKLFVIGSPIATCENHMSINYNNLSFKETIFNLVVDKSKELKTSLIIVKEIPNSELKSFEGFFSKFKTFESLPNSFIPISRDNFPYPNMLRKRYRQRFKSAIKKSDADGYKWKFVTNYSPMIHEMYNLYLNVYEKSEYKFEKLTPSFFERVQKILPNQSFLLTCRNSFGNLICAELIMEGENELIPMYLGLDYTFTTNSTIYNNVIFRTILEAEKRNKNWVVLGQTSYKAKAYSGAIFEKLYLGVYSHRPLMKFFITHFFKFLFPKFLKPDVNNINKDIKTKNYFTKLILESGKKFE